MSKLTLEELKARATELEISFHPSIGYDKLAEKVNAAIAGETVDSDATDTAPEKSEADLKKKASKLIRVNITCMNPAKRDWDGEIITAGNSVVGTFRKFVKFNTDDGYHIPQVIFNILKARKYQVFYNERTKNGVTKRATRLANEFAIDVLPQLTPEELEELKNAQAARG